MPRSQKSLLKELIAAKLRRDDRFVDVGAQLRVWRCNCNRDHIDYRPGEPHSGDAAPAELLDRVYGGRYDRLLRRYVGPPRTITELKCHPGQVEILTMDTTGLLRVLALGSPGAGKTFAAITRALVMALDRPNSTGGLIAPTGDRRQILWDGFLEIAQPLGWVESVSTTKKSITLVNRVVVQILAAKSSSRQYGSPLQGRSFEWAVVDESQNVDDEAHEEIATRGRRAGRKYIIFETATNGQIPAFRIRLEQFKANPLYKRISFTGFENPWVDPEYWSIIRGDMSDRSFREKVLAEDVPPERLTYHRFRYTDNGDKTGCNVMPRPTVGRDITEEITEQRFHRRARYIIGQDFGVLVNASIVLKAYAGKNGERFWWAIDEITSGHDSEDHAARILRFYDPDDVLIVADPHFNSKESDKSDYSLFQQAGLTIVPSVYGKISVKHRVAMFNRLLCDNQGKRRFFIDCDDQRRPKCKQLAQSLLISQLNEFGEPEKERKTGISDPSHWPSAVQFGIFPWEKILGTDAVKVVTSASQRKHEWWEGEN